MTATVQSPAQASTTALLSPPNASSVRAIVSLRCQWLRGARGARTGQQANTAGAPA